MRSFDHLTSLPSMSQIHRRLMNSFKRPTLTEFLVVITITLILIALILPSVKWASSGSIQLPVRIVVFDAARARPIEGAQVAILWAPPLVGERKIEEYRDRFPADLFEDLAAEDRHLTGAEGTVVVDHEFQTGGSHRRPVHAHLRWYWVMVVAEGYNGVVIPVRHESQQTAFLRDQKELLVTIGLMPMQ